MSKIENERLSVLNYDCAWFSLISKWVRVCESVLWLVCLGFGSRGGGIMMIMEKSNIWNGKKLVWVWCLMSQSLVISSPNQKKKLTTCHFFCLCRKWRKQTLKVGNFMRQCVTSLSPWYLNFGPDQLEYKLPESKSRNTYTNLNKFKGRGSGNRKFHGLADYGRTLYLLSNPKSF